MGDEWSPQEVLSSFCEELEQSSVTKRKKGLQSVVECLEHETRCRKFLSLNSALQTDLLETASALSWSSVVSAVIGVVIKDATKRNAAQLWQSLARITELAEADGSFLLPVISDLASLLFKYIRNPSNYGDDVGPLASRIARVVVSTSHYCLALTSPHAAELFQFYASLFRAAQKKLAGIASSGSGSSSTSGSSGVASGSTLLTSQPLVCAHILLLLAKHSPHPQLCKDKLLPFFRSYLQLPIPESKATVVLLSSLSAAVGVHGMSCMGSLRLVALQAMEYLAKMWGKHSINFNMRLIEVCVMWARICAVGPPLPPPHTPWEAHCGSLYDRVLPHLLGDVLPTVDPSVVEDPQEARDSLLIDAASVWYLWFASDLVHQALLGNVGSIRRGGAAGSRGPALSQASQAPKRRKTGLDDREPGEVEAERKDGLQALRGNICAALDFSVASQSLPRYQHLFVFLGRFPMMFSGQRLANGGTGYEMLLRLLQDLISLFLMTSLKDKVKLWIVLCLVQLAGVSEVVGERSAEECALWQSLWPHLKRKLDGPPANTPQMPSQHNLVLAAAPLAGSQALGSPGQVSGLSELVMPPRVQTPAGSPLNFGAPSQAPSLQHRAVISLMAVMLRGPLLEASNLISPSPSDIVLQLGLAQYHQQLRLDSHSLSLLSATLSHPLALTDIPVSLPIGLEHVGNERTEGENLLLPEFILKVVLSGMKECRTDPVNASRACDLVAMLIFEDNYDREGDRLLCPWTGLVKVKINPGSRHSSNEGVGGGGEESSGCRGLIGLPWPALFDTPECLGSQHLKPDLGSVAQVALRAQSVTSPALASYSPQARLIEHFPIHSLTTETLRRFLSVGQFCQLLLPPRVPVHPSLLVAPLPTDLTPNSLDTAVVSMFRMANIACKEEMPKTNTDCGKYTSKPSANMASSSSQPQSLIVLPYFQLAVFLLDQLLPLGKLPKDIREGDWTRLGRHQSDTQVLPEQSEGSRNDKKRKNSGGPVENKDIEKMNNGNNSVNNLRSSKCAEVVVRLLSAVDLMASSLAAALPNYNWSEAEMAICWMNVILTRHESILMDCVANPPPPVSGIVDLGPSLQNVADATMALLVRYIIHAFNTTSSTHGPISGNGDGEDDILSGDLAGASSPNDLHSQHSSLVIATSLARFVKDSTCLLTRLLKWGLQLPDEPRQMLEGILAASGSMNRDILGFLLTPPPSAREAWDTETVLVDLVHFRCVYDAVTLLENNTASLLVALTHTAQSLSSSHGSLVCLRATKFLLRVCDSLVCGEIAIGSEELKKVQVVVGKIVGHITSRSDTKHTLSSRILLLRCLVAGLQSRLFDHAEGLPGLLTDPNFVLRQLLSTEMSALFQNFANKKGVYESFEKILVKTVRECCVASLNKDSKDIDSKGVKENSSSLSPASVWFSARPDVLLTSLTTLTQLGLSGAEFEGLVVFHFCHLAHDFPALIPYFYQAYSMMNIYLGYPVATTQSPSLLGDHFDFIICEWVKQQLPVDAFPFCFFGSSPTALSAPLSLSSQRLWCVQNRRSIVAAIMLGISDDHNSKALLRFADTLQMTVEGLLEAEFADIFARSYALYSSQEMAASAYDIAEAMVNALKKHLTASKFNRLYVGEMNEILMRLLDLAALNSSANAQGDGPSCPVGALPHFSHTTLKKAFHHLAQGERASVSDFLCKKNSDRSLAVIVFLHYEIRSAFRSYRKYSLFKALEVVVDEMGGSIGLPALFRPLLVLILDILPFFDQWFPWARGGWSGFLSKLLKAGYAVVASSALMVGEKSAKSDKLFPPNVVAVHARDIVGTLVAYTFSNSSIATETTTVEGRASFSVPILLEYLGWIRSVCPDALRRVDPFPNHPVFRACADLYHGVCRDDPLLSHIDQFVESAVDSIQRVETLERLHQDLQGHWDQLWTSSAHGRSDDTKVLPKLIGTLVSLCATEQSATNRKLKCHKNNRELLARCLEAIGPVSPSVVRDKTFSDAFSRGSPAPSNLGQKSDPNGDEIALELEEEGAYCTRRHCVRILEMLSTRALWDHDVKVITCAVRAIKQIFLYDGSNNKMEQEQQQQQQQELPPSGLVAEPPLFERLDSLTQEYLAPYYHTGLKKKKALPSQPASTCVKPELTLKVAEVVGKDYERWICEFTHHLLQFGGVKDPVLVACAEIALIRSNFAGFLFPYAVFDILANDDAETGTSCNTMAVIFNDLLVYLQNPAWLDSLLSPPSDYLTPLLEALALVRRQQVIARRLPMDPKTRTRFATMLQSADIIASWFEPRISLLQATQAAQTKHRYFTMLQWLEEWHYARFDQLIALDSDEALALIEQQNNKPQEENRWPDAEEVAAFHSQLVEVYRNVSDPDGIYGVIACQGSGRGGERGGSDNTLFCDLVLAEHEGDWTKSLQIYDSLLQFSQSSSRNPIRVGVSSPGKPHLVSTGSTDRDLQTRSLSKARSDGSLNLVYKLPRSTSLFGHRTRQQGTSPGGVLSLHTGVTSSLHQLGCNSSLLTYGIGCGDVELAGELSDLRYQAAWRAQSWDNAWLGGGTGGFHCHLFQCLKNLSKLLVEGNNGDNAGSRGFYSALTVARLALVHDMSRVGPESVKHVVPTLVNFQLLADAEAVWIRASSSATPGDRKASLEDLAKQWDDRLGTMKDSFELIEPVMSLRSILFAMAGNGELLGTHLCKFAALAVASGKVSLGSNTLRKHTFADIPLKKKLLVKLQEAELSWSSGEIDRALRLAKHVARIVEGETETLKQQKTVPLPAPSPKLSLQRQQSQVQAQARDDELSMIKVETYCKLGEWLAKSHAEGSHVVKDYLEQALRVSETELSQHLRSAELHNVHFQFGRLMDRMFQGLLERKNSIEHEAMRKLHAEKESEMAQLTDLERRLQTDPEYVNDQKMAREVKSYIVRFKQEFDMDVLELTNFDSSLLGSLTKAMEHYIECLRFGNAHDTAVIYRLVTLWFSHYVDSPVTLEKQKVLTLIDQVPSRKFVPLIYQIASRLNVPSEPGISQAENFFRLHVERLIKRTARDHPHHCLYPLFALANGDKLHHSSRNKEGFEVNEGRIQAAADVLKDLKSSPSKHKALVLAQEQLIRDYIDLGSAKYPKPRPGAKDEIQLKDTGLGKLNQKLLRLIPIPTHTIPVRADCNYGEVPRVLEFAKQIEFANSGINRPLIVRLRGTDGVWYKQLVKSADDLRQDAVMEQVFMLVSELLQGRSSTRARELVIRTYNVVPLTPCVGLVEWVPQTTSLSDCLTLRHKGLHYRHARAGEKGFFYWFNYIKEGHVGGDKSSLVGRYRLACEDFRPVFHHWFLEKFSDPAEWFAKRLRYTRSVAVSSLVGYMVGLGDRHNHNVLLDTITAEIVHIDLGVAFDLGKLLKTPEIVPFRLTRDVVDGFGVTGVEGTYRRVCEHTLQLLRDHRETIITVLEVFLHDPLYKWSLSAQKLQKLRSDREGDGTLNAEGEDDGKRPQRLSVLKKGISATTQIKREEALNKGAQRAMAHVKQKLQGTAYGGETLSVAGQVQALINEATDPDRLAQMYYGWAAWV